MKDDAVSKDDGAYQAADDFLDDHHPCSGLFSGWCIPT
jgi:hypothetical protein